MHQKVFKIFLRDEDQTTSPQIVDILEKAGYRARWFVRRADLEKFLEKEFPDLFIVNPFFAHDEGVKFLYWRKKNESLGKIPVIALGKFEDGYTVAQLQAIGTKDHLAKPINAKLILTLCKRILNRSQVKSHYLKEELRILARAPLRFIKVSETTIQAESPVKLTDEV